LLGLLVKDGLLRRPEEPDEPAFTSDVIDRMVALGFSEALLNLVIKLNDRDGVSLTEIANWLEVELRLDGVLP
jgi:hypothetical protein